MRNSCWCSLSQKKKTTPVLLPMNSNQQIVQPAVMFKLCEAFTSGGILGSNFWRVSCTVVSSSCKISYFQKVLSTTYPNSAVNHPRASVPHKEKKPKRSSHPTWTARGKKTIKYNLKRLFCRHSQMSFPQSVSSPTTPHNSDGPFPLDCIHGMVRGGANDGLGGPEEQWR